MTNHHPDIDLLVEFSAGSVSSHIALCVSVHLKYCKQCRDCVSRMQTLGGVLLESQPGEPVSDRLFDSIMARIEHDGEEKTVVADGPLSLLRDWLPNGLDGLDWRRQWLRLSEVVMEAPKRGHWRLVLQKIAAGGVAPLHGHPGREVMVVLQGGFSDEVGVYDEGDFVVFDASEHHRPQAFRNGDCICLTYLEAPLRLEGPIGRWIEKFRGLFAGNAPMLQS